MLSHKDEKISHLESHNQNLEEQIKMSKKDEKTLYRNDNDFKKDKAFKQAHQGQR